MNTPASGDVTAPLERIDMRSRLVMRLGTKPIVVIGSGRRLAGSTVYRGFEAP